MLGGVILGGWVLALCFWMAFGESPHWFREGIRHAVWIVVFLIVCVAVLLIVYGPASI